MNSRNGDAQTYAANDFDLAIARELNNLVDVRGIRDFTEICRNARGAFPTEVLRVLSDLKMQFTNRAGDFEVLAKERFPDPSPVRGSWYFSEQSAEKVSILSKGEVLCLGVPSIAERLSSAGRNVVLVDSDPFLLSRFDLSGVHVLQENVNSARLGRNFGCVILDPPWYFPTLADWISVAGWAVAEGGMIILPLLGELTRPTAAIDRDRILNMCAEIGSLELLQGYVEYEIPRYESRALKRAGVPMRNPWRTSDLLVITGCTTTQSRTYVDYRRTEWLELQYGRHVIAVRAELLAQLSSEDHSQDAISQVPGVHGYVLDTVSHRDPRMANIDIWTSENTVATIESPQRVRSVLAELVNSSAKGQVSQGSAQKSNAAREFIEKLELEPS